MDEHTCEELRKANIFREKLSDLLNLGPNASDDRIIQCVKNLLMTEVS